MKMKCTLKGLIFSSLVLLAVSCSTEEGPETTEPIVPNAAPLMSDQEFEVSEAIGPLQRIATIAATDADGDRLQFSLETDIDLELNPITGAITTTMTPVFDYETEQTVSIRIKVSDTKGGSALATIRFNVLDVDDGPLTNYEKSFLNEYIYLTYKLSPDTSGGALSEKWQGDIKLYMEGVPSGYDGIVQGYLDEFNAFFTDGANLQLVDTQEESNIHLIMGPTSAIVSVWPDMYSLVSGASFQGYALYNTGFDYYIERGRIWMRAEDEGLFKHELGHIMGLGHTTDQFCDGIPTSVMCPGTADEFNLFDREIIKALYRPETEVGKSRSEITNLITEYLLLGEISI